MCWVLCLPPSAPALWRSRDEPGGGGDGGSAERGGQVTRMYRVTARRGRGGCQEVRAPRTCPAVRMRREPAPQGKPFPAPPPAPFGGGGAKPGTGGRAGATGRGRGRGRLLRVPALLKGAAPSGGGDIQAGLGLAACSFYRWKTAVPSWRRPVSGQRARK